METNEPEVKYRNWRSMLLMLTGFLGVIGGILTAVLRWPEWWWVLVGLALLVASVAVDNELDKPTRPGRL